ncbi:MAG: hypothetical protein ABSA58_11055 [Acetobacteraceae bacterium]|jgi:hypothetical protein
MPGGMPRTRILLDQNAPLGLRRLLIGHDVVTSASLGWSTIQNGELIRAAEEAAFAVLITCDRNIRHQQNLAGRQLAVIELTTNQWVTIRDNNADLLAVIETVSPGSYATIRFPKPPKRRRPHPRREC